MSTDAAMHTRNSESSILFMQQEHAKTLKELHEEIAQLQKRCTDLTFQLTMHGLSIDEPGTVDSQVQQVNKELELSREKISSLESELTERDKKIARLEADARSQQKRWLEESRAHSQTTNSLRAELEAKANNIAYLTTELHRLKQKNKSEQASSSSQLGAAGSGSQNVTIHPNSGHQSHPAYLHADSAQSGKKTQTHHHYIPVPPQRKRTLGPGSAATRLRRPGNNKSTSSPSSHSKPLQAVHPNSADTVIGRQQHPLRTSAGARSSGSESPDISPFVRQSKEEDFQVGVKQVLPPIPLTLSKPVLGAQPVLLHQVISTSQKKSGPSNSDAAIVTLAVGNAAPDTAWSLAQDHCSSEYN